MSATLLPTSAHAAFAAPPADREGAVALALLPGVGPRTWRALLAEYAGDAERAAAARLARARRAAAPTAGPTGVPARWAAARAAARALLARAAAGPFALHLPGDSTYPRALLARAAAGPFALHLPGDSTYPRALLDLPDPPVMLWTAGDAAVLSRRPSVAVVGTRASTALGERTTRRIVAVLAECGASVVSGLARGIDTVAHAAALDAGAPTAAVLGTGVDVPYPRGNARLYERVIAAGVVAAEPPPGTPPTPGAFPRRNRIVAALADLVIVVEAPARSGALITAAVAADLGRTVAAVPGSVEAPGAAGVNLLLRDGAHVLADPRDAAGLLGQRTAPDAPGAEPLLLDDDERAIWRALVSPAADLDALAARAALDARRCAAAVTALELRDLVTTDVAGELRRV